MRGTIPSDVDDVRSLALPGLLRLQVKGRVLSKPDALNPKP